MKILYLSHGDPDTDFSGVPLIAKQYINYFSKIGHECALLLPNLNDQNKINSKINSNKIIKFYWPTINEWRLKAFEKKPNEFKNINNQIYFKPDIIHILDWVNFSPSILQNLKNFNVPIIRHLYNFEDFCYFTRPIYFYKNHDPCKAPLSTENCLTCIIKNEDIKVTDKIKSFISNKKNKLRRKLKNRKNIIKDHFDNYYDHLIFPSRSFADFFYDHYKGSKPYSVINHGIDRPKNKNKSFDKNKINIIFCGGTELAKGWFVIENTFRKILEENFKNFNLRIYGDKKFTAKSSLSNYENISFYEKYNPNEIDKIFGWADIAIAPFFFETYSRIVREFMIRGVVPISTNAFGIPDVIDDNVNGFIINKPLEINLYNLLKKLLTDKNILENAKINIKDTLITSPEDELHDIFKIYQKLTSPSFNKKNKIT